MMIKLKSPLEQSKFSKEYLGLLTNQKFYLLLIAVCLAILHFLVAWKFSRVDIKTNRLLPTDLVSFELPFWATIILICWRSRNLAFSKNSIWQTYIALGLLAFTLVRFLSISWLDVDFFILGAYLLAFVFALLSVEWQKLPSYWIYALYLIFMVIPTNSPLFNEWIHIDKITAAVAAFILHYLGKEVAFSGANLTLPTGSVRVSYICAGGPLTLILLKVTLLMTLIYPLTLKRKISLALGAIAVGFGLGFLRVAFLATVVNNSKVFHYWHGSQGGQFFLSAATLGFVLICSWLIPLEENQKSTSLISSVFGQAKASKNRLQSLIVATGLILLSSLYMFFVSAPIQGLKADAAKLGDLAVNNWQLVSTKNIETPKLDITPHFEAMLSGQRAHYVQGQENLDLERYYVVNTGQNQMSNWLNYLTNFSKDIPKNIHQNKDGYYLLTNDQKQANLISCLNADGSSTVTQEQFNQNHQNSYFAFNKIVPWLLGQTLLQDDRCIWIKLSTPVENADNEKADQLLESVWSANYPNWASYLSKNKII
jgi:cyanoexosortase A